MAKNHMTFEREYKNVRVAVCVGDITQQQVDAIVNPANSLLIMGGGVAGALKRVGGARIETEALKHAPIPVGKAIATSAGKLRAKYVIHAPTMETPAMTVGKSNAHLAMIGALKCAEGMKIKSIAFPALGTGVGGFGAEDAAKIMISVLNEHIDRSTPLRRVVFVGFTEKLVDAFKKAIERVLV
jgi:O-acetyl-ADP-ribose deacetylase (regulator of RNase III)